MGTFERRIGSSWRGEGLGLALAWAVAGLGLGCGSDDAGEERVASMLAPAAAEGQASDAAGSAPEAGVRRVAGIELTPRRPVAGVRLSARALFAQGVGPRPEVGFQWRTGSGRVLAEGRELDTSGLEAGTTVEVVATPVAGEETGESFAHRFRLADPEKQIALVVIDAGEGKSVGSVLRAVVETNDEEDGFDVASIEWRVDGKTVGDEEELDTTPFAPGDVVELRARLSDVGDRPITAEPIVLEPSAAPEIRSTPTAGVQGGLFRYAIEASSPARGAILRYELLKGPDGMKVDPATGVLEWRPAASQRGGFDVEVAVLDQWGSGVAQRFGIQADAPSASSSAPPAAPR